MKTEPNITQEQSSPGKWQLQERPFPSNKPVIGPFIDRLRLLWNRMILGSIIWQQNEINQELADIAVEFNGRLASSDHDQTQLTRQIAELTYAVNKMNQRLANIEAILGNHQGES